MYLQYKFAFGRKKYLLNKLLNIEERFSTNVFLIATAFYMFQIWANKVAMVTLGSPSTC